MVRTIAAVVLFLISLQASAASYSFSGHKVKSVSTGWGGEALYVGTEGVLPAGADCGGGNRFIIMPTAPMYKEMLSMLLMSVQNKNSVQFYIDGCSSDRMQLKAVTISD